MNWYYNDLINQLEAKGFEFYTDTSKGDIPGSIMVAMQETEFFGEVFDVFEDGTYEHYSQFKGGLLRAKLETPIHPNQSCPVYKIA